jgi:ABC-type Fe3+-hydroxamate transport system substrate-binding protein
MPPPTPIAVAFATVALLLVAGGCGFRSEPTGAISPAPVTVTDATGTAVALDQTPTRIVSFDPGMTELLFAIGAGDHVVARGAGDVVPAAAERVPVVAPSPAAVRRYRPDLVIANDANGPALRAGLDVPVYVVDGTSINGAERDQLAVGLLAGRGPQGRTVVDRVRAAVSQARAATLRFEPVKTYLDQGAFVRPSALASQLIAAAGGTPVIASSPAELKQTAPSVYLSEQGRGTPPKDVRTQPETKDLPAARRGRVVTIPLWWVSNDGPRLADAVKHLASVLHPQPGSGQ